MGFFKFLKKRDITEEDILDIPPLPPPSQEEEQGLESFEGDIPSPPIEPLESLSPVSLPETEDISTISMAPFGEYETKLQQQPPPQEKVPRIKEKIPQPPEVSSVPEYRHNFIKVARYKGILDELATSKSEAKLAEERLIATHQVYELEGKDLSKLKSVLDDLQKKLIIIDKILEIK